MKIITSGEGKEMKIVTLDEMTPLLDKDDILEAVEQSFISKEKGGTTSPLPMQVMFHSDNGELLGDCHVKAAQNSESPYYAIKIATGFYKNKELGLPVNNGLTLLLSSKTGQPEALFQDGGLLTSLRTAAAGALAVSLAPNITSETILGIIGTGNQAKLQAIWASHKTGIRKMIVMGRDYTKSQQFSNALSDLGFDCSAAENATELAKHANIIVTTTPSVEAILMSDDVSNGVHISSYRC